MRAVVLAAGLAGLTSPEAAGAVPHQEGHTPVTVVALPFQNRSGDEDLDWLSVGIQSVLEAELLRFPGLDVIPVSRQLADAEPEKGCVIQEELECWQSVSWGERLRIAGQLGADVLLSGELTRGAEDGYLHVTLTLSDTGVDASPESLVVEEKLSALPDRLSASLTLLLRRRGLPEPAARRLPWPDPEAWKLHTQALLVVRWMSLILEMPAAERLEAFFQLAASKDELDSIPDFIQDSLEQLLEPLEEALSIAPDDPEILLTAGTARFLESEILSATQVKKDIFEDWIYREVEFLFRLIEPLLGSSPGRVVLELYASDMSSSAVQMAAGLLQASAADFQKSLDLESTSIPARLGLGLATGDRKYFEDALILNPARAATHAALARFLERNGELATSLASWQSCLAISPRNVECRLGQGRMLRAAGRLEEAFASLLDVLGTGRWWFKFRAAVELGALGDRRATAALIHALEKSPPELAWGALHSLTALNAKDSVPLIRQLFLDGKPRFEAVRALGQLGRPTESSALVPFLGTGDVPLSELIRALNRIESGWLDPQALERLLALDGEKLLEVWLRLRRQLCEECETYLRSELAKAAEGSPRWSRVLFFLLKVGRLRWDEDLLKLAKRLHEDSDGELVWMLLLGKRGGDLVWDEESLLNALRSGDEFLSASAVLLISGQEIEVSDEIRKALRDLLQEGPPDPLLFHALSVTGRESPDLYLQYVESPDTAVRVAALDALASVDGRRAIPSARKALAAEDPGEVLMALDLLVHHDEEGQYCPDLPQALPEPPVLLLRFLSTWGSLRCPEGLAVVLPYLDNDDPQVRLAALRAVWRLAGEAAVPRLREAARDASPAVRALAALFLRHGGEGRIGPDALGLLPPGDKDAGPFRTELDHLLPDLLPKLSLEEIRSFGQLTDPDFSALPFSVQTLALLHFATAAPRPAKHLAALESLSRRDAASQSLDRATILEIWKSAGKALPQEKLAENPYLSFFLADTLKEHGEPEEALVWVRKAAALLPASPAEETVLRIALAWVEAESLLRLGRGKDALAALQPIERVLLPETNWFERSRARWPFSARTLLLTALAEEARGRRREALDLLNEAETRLLENADLDDVSRARERKTIAGFRSRVLHALEGKDAQLALRLAELYPARRNLELEAEESAVITALQAAIGAGHYEEAHRLTETYALRRYLAGGPGGFTVGSPGRREIVEELRALQVSIQGFERELARVENADRYGRRQEQLEDAGESEVEAARRRLRDERRRLKTFMVSLKRDHPEVAALVQAEPVEMAELQSLLRDDQVILQYLLLPKKIYLFVLSSSDVSIFEAPHGQVAIDDWVKAYRKAIEQESLPAHERAEGEAAERELVQALLAPVLPLLERYRDLVIVPNGSLHLLPFAALRVDGRYLAERWTISHLSAASLLPVVARGIPANQRLVALANPVHPGWPRLPAAESEVEAIRSYFQLADVHVGEAALKTVLVQKDLRNVNLHLALHSEAGGDGGKPLLVLSDGLLEIEEVWNLYLDGAPLVVLSSCETQVGERISGDEVVSLGNGFLFAGARRVVSSLWPVSGQATRELMKSLYRHLSEGRPAAEALSLAQDAVRRMPHFAAPRDWAAFVLIGW